MGKMTAAKAIVKVMEAEGVEKAFCVPGESYLSVINELYEHRNIELIYGRQEGGVSFMAEGYAKASGKVGVCFATRGPGATNLSIGLHTAFQDSTPLVAFVGQVERDYLGREGFQEVDLTEYFSHLVKWTVEIKDAKRVPELVHRAFHLAKTGRPGPVLVSLPQDLLDDVAEMEFFASKVYAKPRPDMVAVVETLELLKGAKKPVIIAGGGIVSTKSSKELVQLAEKLNIPVTTAFRRFDAFPNQHPLYAGALGVTITKYLKDLIYDADVLLAIGTRFSQITTENYTRINPNSKIIHVDISPDELNKVYRPHIGIVADVKSFLTDLNQLADKTQNLNAKSREQFVKEIRTKFKFDSYPKEKYHSDYVDLEGMIYDLSNQLPSNALITSDAGNFFGWLSRYFVFKEEGTYVGPTSGAMGYGLPSAIGAKVAHPERVVLSFSGDGGFMMTMQELETAVRHKIPVIALIANNNMYGTIRMHQERNFPGRVIATELTNPNFADLAKVMGGYGEVVEKNEDFVPALKRAIESKLPSVIELKVNAQQVTVTKTIDELRNQGTMAK